MNIGIIVYKKDVNTTQVFYERLKETAEGLIPVNRQYGGNRKIRKD